MAGRLRDQANLRRKSHGRQERARVLIVTEGTNTEPQYFNGLSRYLNATGVRVYGIRVCGEGRDPLRVVRRAAEESDNGARIGDRDGYDSVWCVLDVDQHAKLDAAVREARRLGFGVTVSNPCFEIWLLWHFEDHSGHIQKGQLRQKLKRYGIDGKNLPAGFSYPAVVDAISRAAGTAGDIPDNPGTRVGELARYLCGGRR